MDMTRNRVLGIGAATLLTLAGGGALLSRAQGDKKPVRAAEKAEGQPVTLVSVGALKDGATATEASAPAISGQLEAWRTAGIAAQVSEKVVALPLSIGSRVSSGATIARLDDSLIRAQLSEAEAGWRQARAGRLQLEAEYRRASVETRAAIDAARAQVNQAEAGVRQARAATLVATEASRKARSATRAQELAQAEAALRKADADLTLAKTEKSRFTQLYEEGVVARQAVDRVIATCDSAQAGRDAAAQAVSLAKEGARQEDIAAAAQGVAQAEAAIQMQEGKRHEAEAALRQSSTRDARLESLRRQIEGLAAEEARAAARVQQARIALGKHHIVAPFSGRVLQKRTELGETIASGSPVVVLGETARLKATFAIPESLRTQFAANQRVSLTIDALPGRTFTGTVSAFGAAGSARTRTFPLEVSLANPGETLLPGQSARLSLTPCPLSHNPARYAGERGGVVAISAVASDMRGSYVLTVKDRKAVRVPVTTSEVSGEQVIVPELAPGQKVIATPQRVSEGQSVEVLP